jgi:hypothetical protein
MYLGIDQQSGLVYEGIDGPVLPVVPRPTVTQAKLIKREEDWNDLPTGIAHSPMSWIFREDTFDPVTARGAEGFTKPSLPSRHRTESCRIPMKIRLDEASVLEVGPPRPCTPTKACASLLQEPQRGMGLKLALGTRGAASAWRMIQTEVVASGCVMITLKSLSAFGILPALDLAKVPRNSNNRSCRRSNACSMPRSGRLRSRS